MCAAGGGGEGIGSSGDDGCAFAGGGADGGEVRGYSADPGIPLPADGFDRGGGGDGAGGECEEGAVSRAVGCEEHCGQTAGGGERPVFLHGAGQQFWIQHAGG